MLPRDVFDRSVCQQVGEIASPLDRREVFPQVLTAARSNGRSIRELMSEVVGRAAEDSEELVVATAWSAPAPGRHPRCHLPIRAVS